MLSHAAALELRLECCYNSLRETVSGPPSRCIEPTRILILAGPREKALGKGDDPLKKKILNTVTLVGIDCVDIERLRLAAGICQEQCAFADVRLLTSLTASGRDIVSIPPISSLEAYSIFVLTELGAYINSPHILLIQHDGFILNPEAWRNEFLEYDYIGAPWLLTPGSIKCGFSENDLGKRVVGNGGFSLRSKELLAQCASLAKKSLIKRYHPEDMVVCYWCRELLENAGIRFASVELAEQFSIEGGRDAWKGQFGFHGLRCTDISHWSIDHPQFAIDMKSNRIRRL